MDDVQTGSSPPSSASFPFVGTGAAVLSLRRVSYWYGQVIGVNDISLDIGRGVVGLLGPNGAGKSTLLKVLTGQLQPATGQVAIGGKAIWRNRDALKDVGFVPEQDSFYETMTGLEFVRYLTRLQGFDHVRATELAEEAIARVHLAEVQGRRINTYSKGMRQRIKIAQALAHKPSVIFLDEPLAGTDPIGRHRMIELIRSLGDEGATILVSSHILHEVEQMTDEIVLIHRGRLVADGNIFRIREMIDEHPHTIFVDCDDNRRLARELVGWEDVEAIDFLPQGLRLQTSAPDACYARISKVLVETGIEIRRMSSLDNNLTAVFNYLVQ
jgi:ABC-2 type transport system ATP-binding protein